MQVHIVAAHTRQWWEGLSLPWNVSYDHGESSWRGSRLYILLRCHRFLG